MTDLVKELARSGSVTAAVGLIGDVDTILTVACGGQRSRVNSRAPSAASFFDLASLAKPFTASLALELEAENLLPLRLKLGDVWANVDQRLARVELEDLLRHRSGLIAWTPLYAHSRRRDETAAILLSGEFLGANPGTYSDLGYILWAKTAEKALGQSAMKLLRAKLLEPLGLQREVTTEPADRRRLVECALDNSREIELAAGQGHFLSPGSLAPGDIQDGNARWLGAYSGHAGLFGSARALWRLGAEWLRSQLLPTSPVRRALEGSGRYRLGWWRPCQSSYAEAVLSKGSFGHTGFTGGSLWVDPEANLVFALLAHRATTTVDLDPWRRRLHEMARGGSLGSW